MALDQTGSLNERKLAFADKFQDLFILLIRSTGQGQRSNSQRIRKLCRYPLLFILTLHKLHLYFKAPILVVFDGMIKIQC